MTDYSDTPQGNQQDSTPAGLRFSERRLWISYGEDGPPEGHVIRKLLQSLGSMRVALDEARAGVATVESSAARTENERIGRAVALIPVVRLAGEANGDYIPRIEAMAAIREGWRPVEETTR